MVFLPKVSSSPGGGSLFAIIDNKDKVDTTSICKNLARQLSLNYQEVKLSVDPLKFVRCLQSSRIPRLVVIKNDRNIFSDLINEWSKVLGATQQPCLILLFDHTNRHAINYKLLLEKYHVPLVGTVQMGGDWDPIAYEINELRWCGWWQGLEASPSSRNVSDFETFALIRQRWSQVINDNLIENQR